MSTMTTNKAQISRGLHCICCGMELLARTFTAEGTRTRIQVVVCVNEECFKNGQEYYAPTIDLRPLDKGVE